MGIMSVSGYFLTIRINTAKATGMTKATMFPDVFPKVNVLPSIKTKPVIAKKIENNMLLDIFSFKKK